MLPLFLLKDDAVCNLTVLSGRLPPAHLLWERIPNFSLELFYKLIHETPLYCNITGIGGIV
jgi:hypothetical protein